MQATSGEARVANVTGTSSPGAPPAPALPPAHQAAVARLQRAYAQIPPGSPVRLAKRTSNLFRFTDGSPARRPRCVGVRPCAVGRPGGPLGVVGGMTTYEDLVRRHPAATG